MKEKRIVTIGGGSGHSQILQGLKALKDVSITAICSSTDSGGSSGVLRRDYQSPGYLGDLTRCIVALSENEQIAEALLYRFEGGCLHRHSVKNILLLGLDRTCGGDVALDLMCRIAHVNPAHRVIPVTTERTELCARLRAGNELTGEANIDTIAKNPLWHPKHHAIEDIFLRPSVPASKKATLAVYEADWLVICPGDLYSSIIPTVLPRGMKKAFEESRGKVVVVLNVMTKNGETDGYTAEDFVDRIEARIGRSCDEIIYNCAEIPDKASFRYRIEKKIQLTSSRLKEDERLIQAPLVSLTPEGYLYHNPGAVTEVFSKLLEE